MPSGPLGSPLEQMWGRNKFLFFYFSAGIGAGLIYTAVNYYQFNGIYNELVSLGMPGPEIQKILESGRYNTSILEKVSEERLVEMYQIYNTPAVGASGAIYGVLVAFGMTYPECETGSDLPAGSDCGEIFHSCADRT